MRIRTLVFISAWVMLLTAPALPAAAGDLYDQLNAAANSAGIAQQSISLEQVVFRITRATFSLIGVIMVGFLIYSGWLWMTAGDSDKVDKAKTTIRNLIIGFIVLSLSYAIARFVTIQLLKATGNVM